ncbi:MAG TPA: hypothetical protein VFK94_02530, partial [Patescibacteria group bacterium]|nr:hypothetical protein [Patescibacteria group bacterium]
MANGHVKYDPTTGSVEAYAPRFRAINPDDFLSTVRAAIVQAGKMQALDSSPGSLQTPVGKLDLGAGTSQFLGKMRENEAVRQIKKDGPDRYFKGKHRSELSPKLKRLYDQVERQKKKSGFKSDLTGGLGRVLDVLSRFNYGSAEAVSRVWHKSMENDDDSWLENLGEAFVDAGEGFVSGVKGKDKTTFGKVIQEMMDSKEALKDGKDPNKVRYGYAELGTGEKIMKGVAGFTFDVLLDPTTYVGVGMIKAGLKAGKGATAAPKEVDNLVSKLVDEYGIEDINGAKMQDPKTGIGHFLNQNAVMGEAASTGSAQAKTARLRDSLLFAKTARATVMAKEFSRLRETLRTQRHSEYMFLDDTVETSQPMLLDVPMTSEEVAQLAKLRMEHGSLSSEIAKTSKQINELKSRLGAAHPEKAPGKKNNVNAPKGEKGVNANNKVDRARPIKAGSTVPTLGVGAKKAIEKQIAELEARKAALQGESKKLSAKIKDEFNGIDAPPELFASAKALVDEHPDIKNLDRQIRNTRDSLRKTEKRNNRKDAKAAKVDKTTPAAKGAKDEAAATERLADLKARREQRIVELMDEALAKIAPDKGTLTAVVRREDDAKILQRLVDATDPASVQAARRELAYRFAEKGDAWLNSIVQHASKHNDGLVEDLRNLTPLKRPGKHTVRKRQLVVQETPTKVHSKAELARIGKHNKALDKEIDDLAAKQADEIAEGIEDQLLEILIRETTPAFKRGLSVKLNMPFTKANSPETAKVLFTLALPDAVSAAVGKYVFRDTFKEGVTRWANFFKSSAGTDPLMNAMRLAYNGAANFRIEEHAKRLRNMWQHVAPAERRAGFRQWLRHGHLIDENTPGPYATLVQQINDEVSAIGRMFSTTYPDGIKITPSDFNAWLPDKMKFAALKGPDTKLPVGSPEWVRASLRHTEEEIDPAELLWHLHIAREKTLVRTAMKDNVVNLFGLERKAQSEQLIQKLIRKGYKEVPEIGGKYFFPPEVADDISKTFDLMKNQRTTNELIRYYDSVLTVYKSTVTMWNPGYHMRNSFGDGFMNYLAGVSGKSGLDSYRYSAKIIKALKGVGPESPVHAALMDINPKSAFATLENKPSTVLWTTKDGRKVTAEEVWVLYNHYGL